MLVFPTGIILLSLFCVSLVARGQKFHEVSDGAFVEGGAEVWRHGAGEGCALGDVGGFDSVFFGVSDGGDGEFIRALAADDSGEGGAVFERECGAGEAGGDGGIGGDDGFEDMHALDGMSEPREVGSDLAAFAFDAVAADATGFGLLGENGAARFAVAAFQAFAETGDGVGRFGELANALGEERFDFGVVAFGGGFEKFE